MVQDNLNNYNSLPKSWGARFSGEVLKILNIGSKLAEFVVSSNCYSHSLTLKDSIVTYAQEAVSCQKSLREMIEL